METKKIIITGGATRIGRSIALELSIIILKLLFIIQNQSGCKKIKNRIRKFRFNCLFLKADLNNIKETKK